MLNISAEQNNYFCRKIDKHHACHIPYQIVSHPLLTNQLRIEVTNVLLKCVIYL